MTKTELAKILEQHELWLEGKEGGIIANLSGNNLYRADLSRTGLSRADLSGVNLAEANLSGADLSRANLSGAYLPEADLSGAYLYSADLSGAYLLGANLYKANLSGANLSGANLSRADLSRADISGANLSGANLSRTDLYGANLSGANLSGTNLGDYSIVPEEGSFYCFKKLKGDIVAKLYVPKSAKRLGGLIGRKCRVSKAKVVELSNGNNETFDNHTGQLKYELGKWVKPDSFNDDIRLECTKGIHVFMTKKEAEEYNA